ncbi:MAG: nitronate monooxygenase [Lachnospiraceae bacterium]|nr:nitronate monooxygenase [Lachnospiraceae bacterium]
MKIQPLQIGDLTAKLPLLLGGMGVGISLSGLAGAVAREGGVGIISNAQIGYKEPDFYTNTKEANLRAMKSELEKARELAKKEDGTCDGILGFNIMTAAREYGDYVRAAAEYGADIIISGAGLPVSMPEYVAGTNTKIAPIVSSEKAARIILKRWDKRYNRTADLVVIEGAHAGGHLGFKKDELDRMYEEGYDAEYDEEIKKIIACVKEFADKYETHIPVIVAGGIMNAEQAAHVFELGADGIQVSTPFVTTEECDAAPEFKQAYINAKAEDIEIVVSPVGMPARAIHNPFLEKVKAEKEQITRCFRCLDHCNPKEAPYCITQALIRSVQGDITNGLVFCGDNAQYLDRITTVHEVIENLFH